jgi:hypothetical protein
MTVSSTTSSATFAGNGVTLVFDLPFRFFENEDIVATLIDDATGVSTPLSLGVNYSLVGAGQPEVDGNPVSQLTMFAAPATGQTLYVERDMEVDQPTDIVNQGLFFPEIHENTFDRLTMLIQQGISFDSKALRVPQNEPSPQRLPPAAARANGLLGFDSLGQPIIAGPASGSATDLALMLANNTNPALGAGLVGYRNRTVYGLPPARLRRAWLRRAGR